MHVLLPIGRNGRLSECGVSKRAVIFVLPQGVKGHMFPECAGWWIYEVHDCNGLPQRSLGLNGQLKIHIWKAEYAHGKQVYERELGVAYILLSSVLDTNGRIFVNLRVCFNKIPWVGIRSEFSESFNNNYSHRYIRIGKCVTVSTERVQAVNTRF